jgi:hypothetical protein
VARDLKALTVASCGEVVSLDLYMRLTPAAAAQKYSLFFCIAWQDGRLQRRQVVVGRQCCAALLALVTCYIIRAQTCHLAP